MDFRAQFGHELLKFANQGAGQRVDLTSSLADLTANLARLTV